MDKLRGQKQTPERSANLEKVGWRISELAVAARSNPEKVGWRIKEWAAAVGLCRASVYNLLGDQKIESVKSGSARIITTSPREYLTSLASKAV
jgi:hypothetical protein